MRYLYALLAVLASVYTYAVPPGNVLRGTVKDSRGHALEGAIVELPDLKVGAAADSNGNYVISDVPKGKYVVVASLISYSKSSVSVTVTGDTRQDFVLTETAIESHEVVITGQSKATEIRRSPVPIEVIGKEYLRSNISTNVIDAIAKVPGVAEVSTGPNVSKPVIRGLGFNRVLTLYNGMRQEGQQWGDEHGIEVDEYNIERVELIKGPSSLVYGSDALAGVVNLIPTRHAADGKLGGEVLTEYQSNNGLAALSGMLTGSGHGWYWLGRVSHKEAKNYRDPVDGRVYGTSYRETDVSGSVGVNRKWGSAHLDMSLFDDIQAIPDGSRDSATRRFTRQVSETDTFRPVVGNDELNSYKIPGLHQHVQHYRVMSTNNFNMLNGMLAVNAGYERNVRREFSHPEHLDVPGLYLVLNSATYDVRYHAHDVKGWDVTAGLNGMCQWNDVGGGTEFIIPAYRQFDIGPFALVEKRMDKLTLMAGARIDSRTFHNDELLTKPDPLTGFDKVYTGADTAGAGRPFGKYDHTFTGWSYSLGMTYLFPKRWAVKANVARGFRSPNILELSANGAHPGTLIYQLGNAAFRPEFSLQEDIGLEYTSQHLSVSASVFNNQISNYIFNQKVPGAAGHDSLIAGNVVYQFAQTDARLYGGELSVDIHPHPLDWLHIENSLAMVYGMRDGAGVKDSDRYLPFIPPLRFLSEVRADFKKPGHYIRNLFLKVQVQVCAAQDRIYLADNTETRTPGYTLVNAGAGADVCDRKGKALFNISLFGNNLFDAAYQDHLSRPKYFEPYPNDPRGHSGIYNMGRNIGVKVTVPFGGS